MKRDSSSEITMTRWWKFNLVGGIGMIVQFAALFVLKSNFHCNYLVATATAVEAAIVHNFVWHWQFTWADRTRAEGNGTVPTRLDPIASDHSAFANRFVRFNVTNGAVSIFGNLVLMKMMVGCRQMNYLLATVIAIAICALANFVVSEKWVFRR